MSKKRKSVTPFEKYLTKEIGIEYKACLYFFAMLFFYSIVSLCRRQTMVSILHLAEIIAANYILCYVQVYLLWNFDESDHIGFHEVIGMLVVGLLYAGASFGFNWFGRNALITLGFFVYTLFMFLCANWINRIRRRIDEKILNENLLRFKSREK